MGRPEEGVVQSGSLFRPTAMDRQLVVTETRKIQAARAFANSADDGSISHHPSLSTNQP